MMAKSKLVDKAQAYISQISTKKNTSSEEELFKLLKNFFKQKPIAALIADLENIRMLPAESIQNFAHCIDLAAAKVYTDIPETELSKLKFVKFISLIPPEFRVLVLQQTNSNYEIAVEKAILAQECQISNSILNDKTECNQIQQLTEKINALTMSLKQNKQDKYDNQLQQKHENNNQQFRKIHGRTQFKFWKHIR